VFLIRNAIFNCVSLKGFVIPFVSLPLYVKVDHFLFWCCEFAFYSCGLGCFVTSFILYLLFFTVFVMVFNSFFFADFVIMCVCVYVCVSVQSIY
jgi:hypothetical protein